MPDLVARIPRHRGNKNKPDESRWRQQTLPAYRPLITLRCTLPITTIASGVSITLGILIFLAARSGKELVIDYTNCTISNGTLARYLKSLVEPCVYTFYLENNLVGPVMFQYGLEHFYQNSRMYLKSRNDVQLIGYVNRTSGCEPYAKSNQSGVELSVVPCGSIANSMFNDTFKLYYEANNGTLWTEVPLSAENVIEKSERRKFRNPQYDPKSETLCTAFEHTAKPPDWQYEICKLGTSDELYKTESSELGVGLENVDFIVWMLPAALPIFRKNYRSLKQISYFKDGLPTGLYRLEINYNYPVSTFDGSKRFIAVEYRKHGPQNALLGILYIVFGSVLLCASMIILIFIIRRAGLHQAVA